MLTDLKRIRVAATLQSRLTGLLGEHSRIEADGGMTLDLNDFLSRLEFHTHHIVPAWRAMQSLRQSLVSEQRERLHLVQFQAKPLSSFVRNRLIDEVYLPLVGENLAKQMGAADEKKRTDLMGMLLLISPPGYGKTTLMEYVADRLGMIFVRINCPVLGHDITSLDPSKATHSAARQELEKLNLGLAMGSNVMLYLDDIQHTDPEFLQKFISLCDGTRRIDGVFQGEPRTYDLRGKRFAIVMAGNPYTESGDVFKIPDMLANRADIYNLGDVLSGREALFAQSYIENSLTSHPALAPLASRDPADVYRFLRMAQGESVPVSEFAYSYAQAEANEIVELLKRLFRMRDVLLKVNAAYIASAAQADAYRMEPPFKLQGSYRNMSKLAAKASALMREDEMAALIRDHYRGEAQTLTSGAEENLLRLAELLGDLKNGDQQRWTEIKADYLRNRKLGGAGSDGATKVANLAADIATALDGISATLGHMRQQNGLQRAVYEGFSKLSVMQPQSAPVPTQVQFVAPDGDAVTKIVAALFESYQSSLAPTVAAVDDKVKLGMAVWERVVALSEELDAHKAVVARSAHPAQPVQRPQGNSSVKKDA